MTNVEFTCDVVRKTKFREKMRGYHPEEVDAFLERAAVAIEQLQTRLADITERAMRAEAALESNSEADESIRRTLTLAQRTAELAVKEANEDADRIRSEAQTDADRQRAEADETFRRLVADATDDAAALRSEAEEALATATATAATTVSEAEAEATERRRSSEEGTIAAERESAERIAIAQHEADEALAAQAEVARKELEGVVASLTSQRSALRAQVEALATYLAGERARILDVLSSATTGFEATLTPTPQPALVGQANADDEAAGAPVLDPPAWPADNSPAPASWSTLEPITLAAAADSGISNEDAVIDDLPVAGPAAEEEVEGAGENGNQPEPAPAFFDQAPVDDQPAEPTDTTLGAAPSLLFTLEDEMRREAEQETSATDDSKPRKTLLGRRRG